MLELEGKVAVVTGAGSGIGRGCALVLARHGADVVVADLDLGAARNTAAEIAGLGRRAMGLQQDVGNIESHQLVLDEAIAAFGAVDILINNAGVASQAKFEAVTEEDWDRMNDINSKALFFSCQTYGKYFASRRSGKIVNITSFCGKEAIVEYAPYCASKFSATGLTQSLAKELAAFNVNVNAVCPGIVRTRMWDGLADDQWDLQVKKIPLGRGQTPDDIGEAAAFLASERARNITGASLGVTGGLSIW
ncbi:SDR family NAD(P)-dependent oxidoreductase [Paraburkholderia bannensis]|uniref:SDR family NAD(P)-dependent oxidoreductase n=1 Tax=Paraburkholderia bannensis TaxID=765414 RepID=UPI002AB6AAAC|nr:SDR family NAD(P)-dependent oxidoreductase [Paraburkholderia bannensis]